MDGLNGTWGVAVSPDGAHIYGAGREEHKLAVLSRDGVGSLPGTHRIFVGLGDNFIGKDFGNHNTSVVSTLTVQFRKKFISSLF